MVSLCAKHHSSANLGRRRRGPIAARSPSVQQVQLSLLHMNQGPGTPMLCKRSSRQVRYQGHGQDNLRVLRTSTNTVRSFCDIRIRMEPAGKHMLQYVHNIQKHGSTVLCTDDDRWEQRNDNRAKVIINQGPHTGIPHSVSFEMHANGDTAL